MTPPILSTFTLITEIFVTAAVLYIFYKSYKTGLFPSRLAFATLAYEVLFNISYMVYSSMVREAHESTRVFTWKIGVAIFHGVLSLVMFVSLVVFMVLAYRAYRKGKNYFREHKNISFVFLFFWFAAILSGVTLYLLEYFIS
ncbi:MAG: hypothetical protein AAB512_03375 [Patescibacteria group bacterium]